MPFSRRYEDFNQAEAYAIVAEVRRMREANGEQTVGRKVGFTNKARWHAMGLESPMWNYVYDRTIVDGTLVAVDYPLQSIAEPRIEPEIVLHLCRAPELSMSDRELLSCIDWIAPSFEIVSSVFPNWVFSAADATAAFGLHAGLVLGAKLDVDQTCTGLTNKLSRFGVKLKCGPETRTGNAIDILGGPLPVLRFLMEEIARFPDSLPLRRGELVATGTLTEAMPVAAGTNCSTCFSGIDLRPLQIQFL